MSVCQNPACRNPLPPKDYRGPDRRWCSERCRKTQYHGRCGLCGSPTIGTAGGFGRTPELCAVCNRGRAHDGRKWTPEVIVARIQCWAEFHGETPSAREWLYLKEDGDRHWPPYSVVRREFGSWNAAIEAAGFTPRRRGQRKAMAA